VVTSSEKRGISGSDHDKLNAALWRPPASPVNDRGITFWIAFMINRRLFVAASAGMALPASVGRSEAAPLANLTALPVELVSEIDALGGNVVLGAASPDVTLYEFFDYNCGYCRQSAQDIAPLLKADAGLRYVLVNFAVLSEQSILASRIALAFLRQKRERYLAFHQAMFKRRGVKGAEQAIETALSLGADEAKLVADANTEETTALLVNAVRLGDNLGFGATPSYVSGVQAHIGFIDLGQKREAVASMRRCEKMACG
jgi:protein-disulfide isomerase